MEKRNEGLIIDVEDVGPCKKRLRIEVPKEGVQEEFARHLKELRNTAKIPGFRKGKIPRDVLERHYGPQLEEEVKKSLISDSYHKALDRQNLEPLGSPELGEVMFEHEGPLKFDVTLEVKPTFEAMDYKGMKLLRRSGEVTPEEVESALSNISLNRMQLVTEENGEVQGGDQVICDYKVKVDNKEVHQDEEIAVWVSGGMVADIPAPELLVALKGAKVGEKREAAVNLGTKFRLAEYRGKEATIEVIIREIKRPKAPEINDELAKQFGVSSLEELRKNVQKSLGKDKGKWVEQDIRAQICQKLVDMADFELPADLVEVQADEKVYRYKMEQLQRGVPMEHLEEEAEKLKQASQDSVKRDIKLSLVMDDIAEKEKIYVTEQEVEKKIQEIAAAYQMTSTKMRRELEKHESLPGIRQQMKEAKVLDFIQKEAQIENEKKKETQKTESKKGKKEKQETEGTEEKQKVG